MNIFATYPCPLKSARYLDDQRVVKMMTESVQILTGAAHLRDVWNSLMMKPTHVHHPVVLWVADGKENFEWLWSHMLGLHSEWRLRYGHNRIQKAVDRALTSGLQQVVRALPYGSTPHVNCAANAAYGLDFKHLEVHLAYRSYLRARWKIQQANWPATRLPVASVRF